MDPIILYTAFIYFPVVCVMLTAYAKQNRILRYIFKSLYMPSLIVLYLLAAPKPNVLIILAMVFGWIGDVFLLGRHHWNVLGGITSFGLGHICYIAGMLSTRPGLHLTAIISVAWIALCLVLVRHFLIPHAPKRLMIPAICYATLLSGTSAAALYLSFVSFNAAYLLAAFGGFMFMLSDGLLAYNMFGKKTVLGNFFVMVTYVLAQTALAAGFILHGGI
jgi:uncharacterized membrane protein YhhN